MEEVLLTAASVPIAAVPVPPDPSQDENAPWQRVTGCEPHGLRGRVADIPRDSLSYIVRRASFEGFS